MEKNTQECFSAVIQKDEIILENNNIMNIISDNKQNITATILDRNQCVVKNSYKIIQLIGQENFNIVILALKSLMNEKLKMKAIESLLNAVKSTILIDKLHLSTDQSSSHKPKLQSTTLIANTTNSKNVFTTRNHSTTLATLMKSKLELRNSALKLQSSSSSQIKIINIKSILEENKRLKTELINSKKETVEKSSQTEIWTPESLFKVPKKRKRTATTCVVKQADSKLINDLFYSNEERSFKKVNKTVIDPEVYKRTMLQGNAESPDLLDDLSCMSVGSHFSIYSSTTETIEEKVKILLNITQQHTQDDINLEDMLRPEPDDAGDDLHIAAPHILSSLTTVADKCKLLYQQAFLDWKHCLLPNELDNLPIHEAAITNDLDLLKRQCVILRSRGHSVDIGEASNNKSALQLAIQNRSSLSVVTTLLEYGADLLELDDDNCTAFHYAAQSDLYHTKLFTHCRNNIRSILSEHNLWEHKTEDEEKQLQMLFNKISRMFNNEGYNPLMIGSRLGNHSFVEALLTMSADHVNTPTPNSGNTALYLAVENSMLAENYINTIECLIASGADPALANLSGFNVFTLGHDHSHPQLSHILQNYNNQMKTSIDLLFSNNGYSTTSTTSKAQKTITSTGKSTRSPTTKPNADSKVKILGNVAVTGKQYLFKKQKISKGNGPCR